MCTTSLSYFLHKRKFENHRRNGKTRWRWRKQEKTLIHYWNGENFHIFPSNVGRQREMQFAKIEVEFLSPSLSVTRCLASIECRVIFHDVFECALVQRLLIWNVIASLPKNDFSLDFFRRYFVNFPPLKRFIVIIVATNFFLSSSLFVIRTWPQTESISYIHDSPRKVIKKFKRGGILLCSLSDFILRDLIDLATWTCMQLEQFRAQMQIDFTTHITANINSLRLQSTRSTKCLSQRSIMEAKFISN